MEKDGKLIEGRIEEKRLKWRNKEMIGMWKMEYDGVLERKIEKDRIGEVRREEIEKEIGVREVEEGEVLREEIMELRKNGRVVRCEGKDKKIGGKIENMMRLKKVGKRSNLGEEGLRVIGREEEVKDSG